MFKARSYKPPVYEPKIGEKIKINDVVYKCEKQLEGRGADGSHCDPCDFHRVYSTNGKLSPVCTADNAVYLVCDKQYREDKTTIIFQKVE